MDSEDNASVRKSAWRRLLACFRFKFCGLFKRAPTKRVIYPRLELPDYDLHFEYNMNNKHRGIALIFSQENFKNKLTRRHGNDKDEKRLEAVLEEYNFDVKVCRDFSLKDILAELKRVAQMDHSDNDCLIITIMTHGEVGKIFSHDKHFTLDRVTSFFTDEACPSLKGKPRLFFIQACRGSKIDGGHQTKNVNHSRYNHKRKPKDSEHRSDTLPYGPEDDDEKINAEEFSYCPPNHADFLIVRSAYAGYYSLRNPDTGSWFIQALCQELEENGDKYDILNLLTHVNWSISERLSNRSNMKQILCISSMLTKILLFNIKKT